MPAGFQPLPQFKSGETLPAATGVPSDFALKLGRVTLPRYQEDQVLPREPGRPFALTPDEHTVLLLSSFGRSDEELAGDLGTTPEGVDKISANLVWKYGATNRAGSIHRAILNGGLPTQQRELDRSINFGDKQKAILSLIASGWEDSQIARHVHKKLPAFIVARNRLFSLLGAQDHNHSVRLYHELGIYKPIGSLALARQTPPESQ